MRQNYKSHSLAAREEREIMNSRERIISAIRHEVPDRIPLAIQEIEKEYEFSKYIGIKNHEKMVHPDIGYYSPSYDKLGIDSFRLEFDYTKEIPLDHNGEPLNEWGCVAKKDYGTNHWYPLSNAASLEEIESHHWPDPDGFDFDRAAKKAAKISSEYAVRGPHWWPLLCRVFDLVGMEKTLMNLTLEPVLFEAVLNKVFEITYQCSEKLIEACGDDLHILCGAEDFASQQGMLISPVLWCKYLKPKYAKLFELGKKHGKYIWFHSCGNILDVLPDLIDIGMDVWETVQLHTLSISPKQLKNEYGKHITFFGAVNTQKLPFMTTAEVQQEVTRCIELLGQGGGYICSADHGIRADVPFENIETLFETARNFSKQNYTLEK